MAAHWNGAPTPHVSQHQHQHQHLNIELRPLTVHDLAVRAVAVLGLLRLVVAQPVDDVAAVARSLELLPERAVRGGGLAGLAVWRRRFPSFWGRVWCHVEELNV